MDRRTELDRHDDEMREQLRDQRGHDDHSMVLREEQVRVGTERVHTDRLVLRRRIVTEERTITVPVRKEIVELVREPVRPGDGRGEDRVAGAAHNEAEMVLHEEQPVVTLETVAVERIRLVKRAVRDDQHIQVDVAREEAVVERHPAGADRGDEVATHDADRTDLRRR